MEEQLAISIPCHFHAYSSYYGSASCYSWSSWHLNSRQWNSVQLAYSCSDLSSDAELHSVTAAGDVAWRSRSFWPCDEWLAGLLTIAIFVGLRYRESIYFHCLILMCSKTSHFACSGRVSLRN